MNKKTFLNKLEKLLHMLKEEEVRDILSEYEQHIDMKVAEGMSEEDAIAAFGTPEELAAEILDAYHVKADFKESKMADTFAKAGEESKKVAKNVGEAGKGLWSKTKTGLKKTGSFCLDIFKKVYGTCILVCLAPFKFVKSFFMKKDDSYRGVEGMEDQEGVTSLAKKGAFSMGRWLVNLCKWTWRMTKKIWYGCLLLGFGFTGLCMLFLLGLVVVLLFLGYPVIGVTIATIGGTMSVLAVGYYAGVKWRRV